MVAVATGVVTTRRARVPRALHPIAWWLWAAGLATAASKTSNPVLLLGIIAAAGLVVAARRQVAPWSNSYIAFLRIGLVVFVFRVVLYALFGASGGAHVLVQLPQVPLPRDWGIRIGGALTQEGLIQSAEDGLRLATMLICIGAANSLASPARLLKSLPGALYEAGVAVSVAVSFAPQAVASIGRIRRGRRLRGRRDKGIATLRGLAVPVLEGALERSVDLAAAMDARGFGRSGGVSPRVHRTAGVLTTVGLLAICAGSYGLLASGAPAALGGPLVVSGSAVAVAGFAIGSRASGRSRYRPDPWQPPEWLVAASGVAVAATYLLASHLSVNGLDPMSQPLALPAVPLGVLALTWLSALPAWLAPPSPRAGSTAGRAPRQQPHALAGAGR